MNLLEIVRDVRRHLQENGRLSLRMLRRQFELDDESLEEVVEELVDVQGVARLDGKVLEWSGPSRAGGQSETFASTNSPVDQASRESASSIPTVGREADSPALTGERKIVTIVFADLAGSTALQERLDAESARVFMQRYYEAMRAAVAAHGGTVAKLLGDGVLAVFGTPRVAEDDAPRAVHAAFAMHAAFRKLAEEHTALVGAIGLRVAVNTGEVVASGDSEIVGDPVNVAARLQEQCGDGEVVVGEATHRLVSQLVTLKSLGSLSLKGRAEAVKAYRVDALEPPSGVIQAQFVGRDEEIARMTAVFEKAVSTPATALSVLLGSPGLGKSRLIDELSDRLSGSAGLVSAHCDEASGATFAPLVVALREFLEIDSGADADTARVSIEAAIAHDEDCKRIANGIAALFSGSPTSPEETFFVVRRFFAALAAKQPMILVIDDLQWAEPMLLDLVEHLVEWGGDVPLMVLVGARPELRDKRSSLVAPGGLVADVVTLAGLDASAAMRLAANVIGASDLPAAVAAKVLAASEGNPLFVGELVRMLVHEGALKKEGDRWTTGTALAALEMPPTIHALLAARIERLHPDERLVLERAAVVGRHFSRSAVAELLPGAAADLDSRLESLQRSELIERDTGWFLGEPVLRFHHVLIRDAAYRQLLKGARAELHVRFADWVLGRAGDSVDHDETIGWHLEQAHMLLSELGPINADGREIGERASQHLAAAGRRALAGDDVSLAASLIGRAIKRLDRDDAARSELALDWSEALLAAGDVATATEAIEELDRFIVDSARLRAWHTCFAGQHQVLTSPEGLEQTAKAVSTAADVLAELEDPAGEAKAHFVHALALASLGRIGTCEAALDRALAAARRVTEDRRRANTVLAVAPLAALWGPSPVTRASGRCLDVVRVLRITQGAPAVEAVALSCQGVLEALRGRTDAARRMIASSREMVEELGITQRVLEVDVAGGLIDLLEGEAAAAEKSLRRAYVGLRDLGLGIDAARAAALLARALLAQDQAAEAEQLSHESEELAGDDLKAAIAWRGVRAEALARRGEHGKAVEFANKAVEIAAATDALLDHADARLALAAALREAGREREADSEEHRARELWEAKGASLMAEQARREPARGATGPVSMGYSAAEAPAALRRVRENASTAVQTRAEAAIAAGDVAALRAMISDGYQHVDHLNRLTYGPDECVEVMRALIGAEDPSYNIECSATLGEWLTLGRRLVSASGTAGHRYDVGPYETATVSVIESDPQGLLVRGETFWERDLDAAISCLYERYAALQADGPDRERAVAAARSLSYMLLEPTDLDLAVPAIAADFLSVDHRPLSTWSMRGAQAWIDHMRALREVASTVDIASNDVLALEPTALLVRRLHSGKEQVGGGDYERAFWALWCTNEQGQLVRAEWFAEEDAASALARFDELGGGTAARQSGQPVENAASRADRELFDRFNTRDWEGIEALAAPKLVFDERRRLSRNTCGRDVWLEQFRLMFDVPQSRFATELVATRGDRLALNLHRFTGMVPGGGGPLEMDDHWVLHEVDEHGRIVTIVLFDLDDRDAAHAELEARYARGHRAARFSNAATRLNENVVEAWRARDWAAMEALHAPGAAEDDRRRLVGAGVTPGGMLATLRFLFETHDSSMSITPLATRGERLALSRALFQGKTDADGGEVAIDYLIVDEVDENGLSLHVVTLDADELDAAYEELDARYESEEAKAHPRCWDCMKAFTDRVAAGDWDGVAALCADQFVEYDHRSLAVLGTTRGAEAWVTNFKTLAGLSTELVYRNHHLLPEARGYYVHGGWYGHQDGGDYELPLIAVVELDERGLIARTDIYDDATEAAFARLAELSVPASASPDASALANAATRAADLNIAAWIDKDWERFGQRFPVGFHASDRRRGVLLEMDRDEMIAFSRSLGETAVTRIIESEVIGTRGDRLGLQRWRIELAGDERATDDVGPSEIVHLNLWEVDARGDLVSLVRWDDDELGSALAELDARAAALGERQVGAGRPSAPAAPDSTGDPLVRIKRHNAASRAFLRWHESYDIGADTDDWEPMRRLCSAELVFDDRRRMSLLSGDRELMIASARERVAMGARVEIELVGTAGDRILITRMLWSGGPADGRFEIEYFAVGEIDDAGLFTAFVLMDLDDPQALQREAWRRWALIDPDAMEVVLPTEAALEALNEKDLDKWRAAFADDLVFDDHRLAGLGRLDGADAYTQSIGVLLDLAPDTQASSGWFWPAFDHCGGVTVQRRTGTLPEGGDFESESLVLYLVDGGRISHLELYELSALDEALARFEELRSDPMRIPVNAAMRARASIARLGLAEDWAGVRGLLGDDFVYEDRSRHALVVGDATTWLESVQYLLGLPGLRVEQPMIATVGARISVDRVRFSGSPDSGDFEIERIRILEVDAKGLVRAVVLFDPEDLQLAITDAQERFLAGEAAGMPAQASIVRMFRAWSEKDWGALRDSIAPDIVIDDRRPLAFGRLDRDAWIESWRVGAEMAPDVTGNWVRLLDWNEHGRVLLTRIFGTRDGGEFENVFVAVVLADENVATNFEWFPVEEAERAVARFRELCAVGCEDVTRSETIEPATASHRALLMRAMDAWNSYDTAVLSTVFAEDIVVEDYRHAGLPSIKGRDQYLRANEVLWELAPDQRLEFDLNLHAHSPDSMLVTVSRRGTLPEGGDFESVYLIILLLSDDRIARAEMFELGALDQGLARFEELRKDPLRIPPNDVVSTIAQSRTARSAEEVRTLVADDFVFEDRKKHSHSIGGVDDWIASLEFLRTEAQAEPTRELIAALGPRLALFRMLWSGGPSDGRFEIEHLFLGEVDGSGLFEAVILFDADDRAGADTELFERYVKSGADGLSAGAVEYVRGWNAHDLERVRSGLSHSFVLNDHCRSGMGLVEGVNGYLAAVAALYELVPDVRIDFVHLAAVAEHGCVCLGRRSGHNTEGGAVESQYVVLMFNRGDELARLEFYEPEHLEQALARFEELGAHDPDELEVG